MRVWEQDGIEVFVAAPASGRFTRHRHDEYVISANVCGIEYVRLDRRRFTLGTDELTLYNPGEVQSSEASVGDGERWSCVSVYVDPGFLIRRFGFAAEFQEPVITAPVLRAELLTLALSPVDDTTPGRVEWLLNAVLNQARLGPKRSSPEMARAHAWLLNGPERGVSEPVNIGQLAAHLGWSRETFTRRFTQATGTPPYAWHLQARLRRARRLLRQGQSPAEVAVQAGFTDQAHLHKLIQAAYSTTPSRIRLSAR
ncbi:helix-turn-helix domain-containing protein [Amycolatopsis sp. cmx-11-12]|uniref:AraC family transcriptional regulator n=1 Tax=Amycolatopsis sp. cmx-11-12 TaxID=2785795 RepID=UPI00391850CD